MALNSATSGLTSGVTGVTGRPPKLVSDLKNTAQQTQRTTARAANQATGGVPRPVTDAVLPGQFPGDENNIKSTQREPGNTGPVLAPLRQWFSQALPRLMDRCESKLMWLLSWFLPAPGQARVYEEAARRPASTTFLLCQLICCGIPLLIFLAGVFVFAAVAILLWAVLSLLILGPVLLVASMLGVSMWGWGWLFYGLIKWIDQTYLGGLISRFWFSRASGNGPAGESTGAEGAGDADGDTDGDGGTKEE
ncbi:hypothetical protein BO70DRAFT_361155 [Aspergillus heteromorphus CBS 117.55]|uniref:Uncharacterized protein n=1 Tax=Aspergillus heteromorphus CBS 117.55 TaxID=1448321 RepID=A0A317WKL6_9EURO|nr:uncharacterized protein BO70DRAFT_361155 [Aspergillus heteromorphus CBS 117.55]PWY84740.1 hypothetical protein BO70DRAFT_361155 [Aspergillus heteromorphus CBS 117.55]